MEFLEIISSKIDKEAIVNLTCELIKEREVNPPGNEYLAKNLYLKGIPGVVHSPGRDSVAHQPNEYVEIGDLFFCSKLWAGVIYQIPEEKS